MDLAKAIKFKIDNMVNETSRSWLLKIGDNGTHWFPKSECRVIVHKVYVPQWIADEKELTYDLRINV